MSVPKLEPDRWYVAIFCTDCGYRNILFEDLTAGKSDFSRATATLVCVKCKKEFTNHLESYQHADDRQSAA